MSIVELFLQTASNSLPVDEIAIRTPNPCILEVIRLLSADAMKPCETEKVSIGGKINFQTMLCYLQ